MKRHVLRTEIAELDMAEAAEFLTEEAGLETALRFLSSLEASFSLLLEHPEMGRVYAAGDTRLSGMRAWRVHHFERYLIFYQVSESSVTVYRVLHGSRDLWSMLGLESP